MKRTYKNIIVSAIAILMCIAVWFTLSKINSTSAPSGMPEAPANISEQADNTQTGTPPSMPSGNNSGTQTGTPPTPPSGDNSGTQTGTPPTPPSGDTTGTQTGTPPTPPSGDTTGTQTGTPPTPPSGDNSGTDSGLSTDGSTSETAAAPTMPSGNQEGTPPNMHTNSESKVLWYVLFGVECAVFSASVVYLVMSAFNKKTFRETFNSAEKVLAGTIVTVMLAAALTTAGVLIGANNKTNAQMPSGASFSTSAEYSASNEVTADETGKTYESTTADNNALLVSGKTVTVSNATINKTGDSAGGDNSSFYGTNAAVIAKDGANLTLKNINVTTNGNGANGVFCYGGSATTNNATGDGTTVNISDSTITTTGDGSGGIMTTGGGIMNAENLTVTTSGVSSAAIRTDRGGGTVKVTGGTYTTNGAGSPAIYSTADVTVTGAKLVSNTSEGAIIEGKNSITLDSCELYDNNTKLNGQSTTYKNVFLYQSQSGDAATGTASFTAKNSKITTEVGDSFYVTNTSAVITLENNTIVNNDKTGNFLRIQKDSWGQSGSNGGTVTLSFKNQKAAGNIVVDSISSLDFTLSSGSYFEGAVNADNTAKTLSITVDASSKIKLTGNWYLTSFTDADSTYSNIDFGSYNIYVNGVAIK